jgi:8-amino-7-oxononanoate synthase
MDKFAFVDAALEERRVNQRWRSLSPLQPQSTTQVQRNGRSYLNFSSNDYLGLSKHPVLIAAAQDYTQKYGTGATASRLVAGTYDIHEALECQLATAYGQEAALVFTSGFQTNVSLLNTMLSGMQKNQVALKAQPIVLCDRLIHNSLLQGILASGTSFTRYRHNDLQHLEQLLVKATDRQQPALIVTETIFSMDGDRTNIDAIIELAQRFNAILYLDDAHAIGVYGQQGMGLTAGRAGIDLVVGTFGKAFGSSGAFVACSQRLRDYFINFCPGFIYTTALPPSIIGSIQAALQLIPTMDAERQQLWNLSAWLRSRLQTLGYATGASDSQIVPILIGSEQKTLAIAQGLEERSILAVAIRPPTVAAGTARIRLALSSCHTEEEVEELLEALGGAGV